MVNNLQPTDAGCDSHQPKSDAAWASSAAQSAWSRTDGPTHRQPTQDSTDPFVSCAPLDYGHFTAPYREAANEPKDPGYEGAKGIPDPSDPKWNAPDPFKPDPKHPFGYPGDRDVRLDPEHPFDQPLHPSDFDPNYKPLIFPDVEQPFGPLKPSDIDPTYQPLIFPDVEKPLDPLKPSDLDPTYKPLIFPDVEKPFGPKPRDLFPTDPTLRPDYENPFRPLNPKDFPPLSPAEEKKVMEELEKFWKKENRNFHNPDNVLN
jgi:hypothetical protein